MAAQKRRREYGRTATKHLPKTGYLVAILSKYPIKSYSWQPDDSVYRWNLIYADIELPGNRLLKVASTHYGWWGQDDWWREDVTREEKLQMYLPQTEFLLNEFDKNKNIPFVIGGDFNHPDEYHANLLREDGYYADVPNRLIRQFYPRIRNKGYSNIYLKLNGSFKDKKSCIARGSGVIDHIFASKPIADAFTKCEIIDNELAFQTSDHLSVYADLELWRIPNE